MMQATRPVIRLLFSLALILLLCIPAIALKLPGAFKSCLQKTFAISRIRLDGALETKDGSLYLPLIPTDAINEKNISLKAAFPSESNPEFLLFTNGWCYLKVKNQNNEQTVVSLEELSPQLQKALLATHFPSDLIVPERFVLPISLKPIIGTVAINIKKPHSASNRTHRADSGADLKLANETASHKFADNNSQENKDGCILVTSPGTGKISLLSFPDLTKIIEFSTAGTPSGVTYIDGKVYISDLSKCRVLILDPYSKLFLGQIDLPKHSTPKDVVVMPISKLLYVSESLFNDVAVFEGKTDKLLLRTKVDSGPGRMAITPNGNLLLVINGNNSKVSFVSTQDQRYLGMVKVGSLPNSIAISADSKLAYITNRVSNSVSVIDLVHHAVINNIETGSGPTGIIVDSDNNKLYVANAKEDSIGVFSLKNYKKLESIKLPVDLDFPGSLTLLPDKKHVIVSSELTDTVGMLNIATGIFEKLAQVGHNTDQCLWIPAKE